MPLSASHGSSNGHGWGPSQMGPLFHIHPLLAVPQHSYGILCAECAPIHTQCPHPVGSQCHLHGMRTRLALSTSPMGAQNAHNDFPRRRHNDRIENTIIRTKRTVAPRAVQTSTLTLSHKLVDFISFMPWDKACQLIVSLLGFVSLPRSLLTPSN